MHSVIDWLPEISNKILQQPYDLGGTEMALQVYVNVFRIRMGQY